LLKPIIQNKVKNYYLFLIFTARWFNIEILSVDVETQICDVFFIGMKEKVELSSIFVKLLPAFSPTIFQAGTYCEAIYSEDGNFYACVIEKVEGDEFHIRFKKYNKRFNIFILREVKTINYLRESKNADYNKKIQFENLDTFKVPDYLKILPVIIILIILNFQNDTEEQRQKKKKKIKALK
jgi:survival of motor neuron-related-splicing factor 30